MVYFDELNYLAWTNYKHLVLVSSVHTWVLGHLKFGARKRMKLEWDTFTLTRRSILPYNFRAVQKNCVTVVSKTHHIAFIFSTAGSTNLVRTEK
jgi:hypothetical protein